MSSVETNVFGALRIDILLLSNLLSEEDLLIETSVLKNSVILYISFSVFVERWFSFHIILLC